MSEYAYLIPYPGADPILTSIYSITPNDKDKDYRCNGVVYGKTCYAPLCPVFSDHPHLRLRNPHRYHHIPGCPCDKSADALRVDHLDRAGTRTSPVNLLERFGKFQKLPKKRIPAHNSGSNAEETDAASHPLDTRPHRYGSRLPDTLSQAIVLWSALPVDAPYAGTTVGNLLIDSRNIHNYRANGIPAGRIAVVLCSMINKDKLAHITPNRASGEIILQDAYPGKEDTHGLLIAIKADYTAAKLIFGAKGNIIAIMAQWIPHPTIPNAYTSTDIIRRGNVCIFNREFFG